MALSMHTHAAVAHPDAKSWLTTAKSAVRVGTPSRTTMPASLEGILLTVTRGNVCVVVFSDGCGVRGAGCGVRCAVCGVRCTVCGCAAQTVR